MLFSHFFTLLSTLVTFNTTYTPLISSYFITAQTAFHHCTFSFITAHFVHHCTLKQALTRGRHSQGAYKNIGLRCCFAGVYAAEAVLLKYIGLLASLFCLNIGYTGDAFLLEYIRAMLGVATPRSGDSKPLNCIGYRAD